MYYAADNHYSTETNLGHSNTWFVLAFDNRKNRDAWVRQAPGRAARQITRHDIPKYIDKVPKLFSKECYALTKTFLVEGAKAAGFTLLVEGLTAAGFRGYIDITTPDSDNFVEALNK